jgi:uncharacterized protein YndB with AHSA1/START domain
MTTTEPTQRDFTLIRTLEASPAEVFRAWTDPDRLEWFYNPSMPIPSEPIELDLRIGRVWRQQMVIDESTAYVTGGVYREIVPDERLVFTWGATDGWPRLDPDRLDDGPLVTVVFGQVDGRTELTVHVELPAHLSDEGVHEWWSRGIRAGWRDTIDRLVVALAGPGA